MKVKILKSLAGLDFSYSAGQKIELDTKTANDWINAGIAAEVGETNGAESDNAADSGTGVAVGSKVASKGRRK